MITIDNKKLHDYLMEKDSLVKQGRGVSVEIEALEKKIQSYQNKEKVITSRVECKEEQVLIEEKSKLVEALFKEVDALADTIREKKLAGVPENIRKEHMALLEKRKALETERNKFALKVQKIKDRVKPIIQKEMKPILKEYEDINTVVLNKGKIEVEVFSHLEDWKKAFNAKKR